MPHFYLGNLIFHILSLLANNQESGTLKKSQLLLSLITWVSGAFMLGFVIAGFLIVQFSLELPDAQSIRSIELKVPLRVYSADNLLISEFGNERRKPIAYEDTPQQLIDAVLASEDDGFFDHIGVDFKGLFRAALSNVKSGNSGQGASTITMQVARNFFLNRDKTYTRKLKEVLLAFRLEQILSKEEILSLYLNKIFLGHRAYGFGAAAEVYYAKELTELSTAQIAMLAGLPKAPSTFNPLRNPERAIIRRNYVLGRLMELQKITRPDYDNSIAAPISAQKHGRQAELVAPHIAEMVRAQLTEQYGEGAYWQGLNVYTTILSEQQVAAQASLRKGLQAYDRRHGFRGIVGHFDFSSIEQEISPEDLASRYEEALRPYPNSQEQIPALVLNVSDEESLLWTREYDNILIELATSKWARRHKTPNLLGDRPNKMSELMEIGDIIYVHPEVQESTEADAQNTENDDQQEQLTNEESPEKPLKWRLSQIPNISGALISMQPSTGKILSLIGGYDFFLNKYNRATQSIRQPGSNIKPFIYSASLDKGFTPASLINGSSIVIRDQAHGTLWRPENYSGKFFGPTRIREALGKSMNLVSIRLLRAIGIPFARQYAERFGIDMNRFSASLTMALGSGGVRPIEMLSAYSVLANGGYKVEPYFVEKITDRDGNVIYRAPQPELCDECYAEFLPKPELPETELESELEMELEANSDQDVTDETIATDAQETNSDDSEIAIEIAIEEVDTLAADQQSSEIESDPGAASTYVAPRVMSHANNFLTVSMMKDVVRRGTARRALALNRQDLAGKTGTTNDYVDAWFTGFNSKVATTVWVGFDNPSSMGRGEAGSLTALPIWVDYMQIGLKDVPEDNAGVPEYIETRLINRNTGKPTDDSDPSAMTEFFTIEELTPEARLLEDLYGTSDSIIDLDDISSELLQGLDGLEGFEGGFVDNALEVDGEVIEDSPIELNQQDRIIEETEDTEGLF